MNTEPVRTNGAIAIAIITAIVGSATALQAALVDLMIQMQVNPDLARSIGTLFVVVVTVAGSAVTIWRTGERTRRTVTAWSPTEGAATPGPANDPMLRQAAAQLQADAQEEVLMPDLSAPEVVLPDLTKSWEADAQGEGVYDPITAERVG